MIGMPVRRIRTNGDAAPLAAAWGTSLVSTERRVITERINIALVIANMIAIISREERA